MSSASNGSSTEADSTTAADPAGQIERVAGIVRELMDDGALGLYLHGSAALGGLRPHSDLDLFAVVAAPMSAAMPEALTRRLMPISGRGDPTGRSRPVELTIVAAGAVRPWRYPPALEFQYGDWWRPEYGRGSFAPWTSPNPDVAIAIHQVLAADRPVFGPPPATLLDAVPWSDVRRSMLDGIPGLLGDLDGDEANVLLTLARILMSMSTGVIAPKDVAAAWAMERLAPQNRPALALARSVYLGSEADDWRDRRPALHLTATALVNEIDRPAGAEPAIDAVTARPANRETPL